MPEQGVADFSGASSRSVFLNANASNTDVENTGHGVARLTMISYFSISVMINCKLLVTTCCKNIISSIVFLASYFYRLLGRNLRVFVLYGLSLSIGLSPLQDCA